MRSIYNGGNRRLVLAFDVGTTDSCVSYCFLQPGTLPEIRSVSRYPGQREGDLKIPSIIVYGPNGHVRAIGAEAEDEAMKDTIEVEGLFVSRWFKLHLRPQSLRTFQLLDTIPPLPPGKTVVRVLADMLRYLYNAVGNYIIETTNNGAQILESEKDIILTHPNEWEGAQQAAMRQAAILAGLIPDTQEGRDRVLCVAEGEAKLHYCVSNETVPDTLRKGDSVLVVDAGRATIDISSYQKKSNDEPLFEEAAPPECYFEGSIFVTQRAKAYLKESLRGSKYYGIIDYIAECFDKTTKLTFRSADDLAFVRFGSLYDRDPQFNIQSGKMRLERTQIARFFEPLIGCIANVIEAAHAAQQVKTVCLVGSFSANDWSFNSLQTRFQHRGISICRPHRTENEVAIGAIAFYLNHCITAQAADLSTTAPGGGNEEGVERTDAEQGLPQVTQASELPRAQPQLLRSNRPSESTLAAAEAEDIVELGGMRYKMWRAMIKSLEIPQFGYSTTLDLTALHDILPTLNAHIPVQYLPQSHQPSPSSMDAGHSALHPAPAPDVGESYQYTRLTYTPILLKTLSKAMMEWPLFRSSIVPTTTTAELTAKPRLTIRPHSDINISLQTPSGVYTPTLQRVNARSIYSLSSELEHLSHLARQTPCGLTEAEMPKQAGTITVSNVGEVADCDFTSPVLVPGGIAIVAIGRPKWVLDVSKGNGGGERRFKVGISWSADHRVVENGELAGFVECWKGYVEHPLSLIGRASEFE